MKKLLIAILMLLIGGGGYVGMDKLGGFGGSNVMYRNLTNSSSTVPIVTNGQWGTNPTPVVEANTGRIWLKLCKTDGYDKFWVHFTNVTSSEIGVNEGIELTTTTPCLTLDGDGLWLGKIWATGNATSLMSYSEASQ